MPTGFVLMLISLRVLPLSLQRLGERARPLPGCSGPCPALPAPVDMCVVRREPALPLHVGLGGGVLGAVLVRGLAGPPAAPALLRPLDGITGAVTLCALHVLLPAPARVPALRGEMRLLWWKAQGCAVRPGWGREEGRPGRGGRSGGALIGFLGDEVIVSGWEREGSKDILSF